MVWRPPDDDTSRPARHSPYGVYRIPGTRLRERPRLPGANRGEDFVSEPVARARWRRYRPNRHLRGGRERPRPLLDEGRAPVRAHEGERGRGVGDAIAAELRQIARAGASAVLAPIASDTRPRGIVSGGQRVGVRFSESPPKGCAPMLPLMSRRSPPAPRREDHFRSDAAEGGDGNQTASGRYVGGAALRASDAPASRSLGHSCQPLLPPPQQARTRL